MSNPYASGDESDEEVAFLSSQPTDIQEMRRFEATLRPLEVMQKKQRRLVERDNPEESGVFACKMGILLTILGILCGIYEWSTHQSSSGTTVDRYHQLKLADIHHWCLDTSSRSCQCSSPLDPQPRFDHKTWRLARDGNIREAQGAGALDVVFLGDSIIEGWRGMSLGIPVEHKQDNRPVFDKLFHTDQGADFQGLALGIAGDKSPNLLWRIQHGEVPDSLRPSVWWILIGTNDFMRSDYCSPDVVSMGIKRVAEEMRWRRPHAKIVINSLLPRSDRDDGKLYDPARTTVWEGITQVNAELKEYCEQYKNLVFFDSSSLFIKKDNVAKQENWYISDSLMGDYLHPTALGYQKWGDAIVKALHTLLDAQRAETGRKPLPPE